MLDVASSYRRLVHPVLCSEAQRFVSRAATQGSSGSELRYEQQGRKPTVVLCFTFTALDRVDVWNYLGFRIVYSHMTMIRCLILQAILSHFHTIMNLNCYMNYVIHEKARSAATET